MLPFFTLSAYAHQDNTPSFSFFQNTPSSFSPPVLSDVSISNTPPFFSRVQPFQENTPLARFGKKDIATLAHLTPQSFYAIVVKELSIPLDTVLQERVDEIHTLAIRLNDDVLLVRHLVSKGVEIERELYNTLESDIHAFLAFLNSDLHALSFDATPDTIKDLLKQSFERRVILLNKVSETIQLNTF